MRSRLLAPLLLTAAAVALQALLPLGWGEANAADPLLALLAVLALRQGRLAGTLWGALLGTLRDAFVMPYIGFHGAAYTLLGHLLGWVGQRVVLQGILPLFFFAAASYVGDAALVAALFLLLGLSLPPGLWVAVLLGALLTGMAAAALEGLASRLYPREG
jgi:rod shape-determining protein MreD